MSDGMTWKDQWHSHRAQAVIFEARKRFYTAQARRDREARRHQDALRHRELAKEYRDKATMERARAADIKQTYLSPLPKEPK